MRIRSYLYLSSQVKTHSPKIYQALKSNVQHFTGKRTQLTSPELSIPVESSQKRTQVPRRKPKNGPNEQMNQSTQTKAASRQEAYPGCLAPISPPTPGSSRFERNDRRQQLATGSLDRLKQNRC